MRRRNSRSVEFATYVVLATLVLGQHGLGLSLLSPWFGEEDGCCSGCPCESEEEAHHTHHDEGAEPSEDERSEGLCPLGCSDCLCCSTALVAVTSSAPPRPHALPGGVVAFEPAQPFARGVIDRIYRPPRPALSVV